MPQLPLQPPLQLVEGGLKARNHRTRQTRRHHLRLRRNQWNSQPDG